MEGAGTLAATGATGATGSAEGQTGSAKGGQAGAAIPQIVEAQTWPGQPFNGLLTGKVAVVTGAARGIGRAIAADFAANGADDVGIDIAAEVSPIVEYPAANADELAQTGTVVKARGRKWLEITADIRDIKALRAACAEAEQSSARSTLWLPMRGSRPSSRCSRWKTFTGTTSSTTT